MISGVFDIIVFFNVIRFFQTVNGKVTRASSCVDNDIKEPAAAPLLGLVLASTKRCRAISQNREFEFSENPKPLGRGEPSS